MKKLFFICGILISDTVFAMDEQQKKQELFVAFAQLPCNIVSAFLKTFTATKFDQVAFDEFITNKDEILEECVDCVFNAQTNDPKKTKKEIYAELLASNNLFAAYSTLALTASYPSLDYIDKVTLIKADLAHERVASKIKQLQAVMLSSPVFYEKLAAAQLTNNAEDWKNWRFAAGDSILRSFLAEKGVQYPDPRTTYKMVIVNAHISEETADWMIAHSAILYLNRAFQRKVTGQHLPPLQIRAKRP